MHEHTSLLSFINNTEGMLSHTPVNDGEGFTSYDKKEDFN